MTTSAPELADGIRGTVQRLWTSRSAILWQDEQKRMHYVQVQRAQLPSTLTLGCTVRILHTPLDCISVPVCFNQPLLLHRWLPSSSVEVLSGQPVAPPFLHFYCRWISELLFARELSTLVTVVGVVRATQVQHPNFSAKVPVVRLYLSDLSITQPALHKAILLEARGVSHFAVVADCSIGDVIIARDVQWMPAAEGALPHLVAGHWASLSRALPGTPAATAPVGAGVGTGIENNAIIGLDDRLPAAFFAQLQTQLAALPFLDELSPDAPLLHSLICIRGQVIHVRKVQCEAAVCPSCQVPLRLFDSRGPQYACSACSEVCSRPMSRASCQLLLQGQRQVHVVVERETVFDALGLQCQRPDDVGAIDMELQRLVVLQQLAFEVQVTQVPADNFLQTSAVRVLKRK